MNKPVVPLKCCQFTTPIFLNEGFTQHGQLVADRTCIQLTVSCCEHQASAVNSHPINHRFISGDGKREGGPNFVVRYRDVEAGLIVFNFHTRAAKNSSVGH